jgi:phosphoserine phosphatase
MRYNIVALDFDGVLVKQESAWWTVHKAFGTYNESKPNLRAYEEGDIDYVEFMKRDIALWGKRQLEEVKDILLKYDLNPQAESFIKLLRTQGRKVVVVSAGIDLLVEDVARRLGIERFLANGLEADHKGQLTGNGIFRVDLNRKDLALKKMVVQQNGKMTDVVAVGDSKYDLHFLRTAGLGIGFGDPGESNDLHEVADGWAKKLMDIPKIIKKFEKG